MEQTSGGGMAMGGILIARANPVSGVGFHRGNALVNGNRAAGSQFLDRPHAVGKGGRPQR